MHNRDKMSQMQQKWKDDAEIADPRASRTDSELREALIALLIENHFDNITVGKIAQQAQVNRATFYRHYQDKFDLASRIIESAFDDLADKLDSADVQDEPIDLAQRLDPWVNLFKHVGEHARLYQALLGKNRDPWMMKRMRKSGERLVRHRMQSMQSTRNPGDIPEEVAIAFAIELLLGIIGWWLEGNLQYSPEQIASWFIDFISFGYFHALGFKVHH